MPFTTSVIKGAVSEYVLCIIFYASSPQSSTEVVLWKQTLNFSDLQNLVWSGSIKSESAGRTVYLRIYVDDVKEVETSYDGTSYAQRGGVIDVSGYSGNHAIKVVIAGNGAGFWCKLQDFSLIGSE